MGEIVSYYSRDNKRVCLREIKLDGKLISLYEIPLKDKKAPIPSLEELKKEYSVEDRVI